MGQQQLSLDVTVGLCRFVLSGFGKKQKLCGQPATYRAWWAADDGWAVDAAEDENSGPMGEHFDACRDHADLLASEWYAHFFCGGTDRRGDEWVNPSVGIELP